MDCAAWNILLKKYGQRVGLVFGSESRELRAFFQPVQEKKPGQEPTPLGYAQRGHWRYLGPSEPDIAGADGLTWDGRRFRFIRCRKICIGSRTVSQWGLAVEYETCQEEAGL